MASSSMNSCRPTFESTRARWTNTLGKVAGRVATKEGDAEISTVWTLARFLLSRTNDSTESACHAVFFDLFDLMMDEIDQTRGLSIEPTNMNPLLSLTLVMMWSIAQGRPRGF